MSMPVERATAKLPISDRADVYGMPGYHIDGNNILDVYETMATAAEHARQGAGPVLIEAVTYRYFGHSKSDRNLYRTKDEINEWKEHDPIERFKTHLINEDVLTENHAENIDESAQNAIEEAVKYAMDSPEPDPATLTEFVYA